MDEQRTNITQQAQDAPEAQEATQKEYPFVVAITAALLSSSCSLDESQKRIADPKIMEKLPKLIRLAVDHANKENPARGTDIANFDPRLDPTSEKYDADAYHAAINELNACTFYAEVLSLYKEWTEGFQRIRESFLKAQQELDQPESWLFLPQGFYMEIATAERPQLPTVLNERQMLSVKSKVVDVFSRVRFSDAEKGVVTIEIGDKKYSFTFTNFNKLKGTSGISTHKLLRVALSQFTQNNHYGATSGIKYRVDIPLKDYARALGYKIDVDPTAKDQDREKNRASEELKNARKRIRQDLDILFACKAEWREEVKGSAGDFGKCQFFDRVSIHNGIITLDFGRYISDNYLSKLPLTYFPRALLSIDGRNENAYQIGLAISDHYHYIYNHIGTGNPRLLRVKTLLDKTTLPTIETVRKNRRSWEERIKEPFETALDKLYQAGVIADWKYSRAKDEDLTDDEAAQIDNYETFSSLFIHYEIKDPANLDDAIEKKRAQIAARAASKKNQTKTKKKG